MHHNTPVLGNNQKKTFLGRGCAPPKPRSHVEGYPFPYPVPFASPTSNYFRRPWSIRRSTTWYHDICRTIVSSQPSPVVASCNHQTIPSALLSTQVHLSFAAARPRLWNGLPTHARPPGLTPENFYRKLKTIFVRGTAPSSCCC